MKKLFIIASMLSLVLVGCKSKYASLGDGIYADIQTNKGDIIIKLHHKATPLTVANFVSLAEGNNPYVADSLKNKKYYDGLIFHRVMKDFMIQGGDILGTGYGGPGYKFKDEFVDSLTHDGVGVLSMANGGPKSNGSQFFITHKPKPHLDGVHSVFGIVVEGLEVVDSIANVEVGQGNRPVEEVVMNHVIIIRNGKEAKNFDAVKIMDAYFEEERQQEAAFQKMISDLLAEFATQKEAATTLDSGLQMYYVTKGDGEKPKIGQQVNVFYAGYFEDGKLFDSNYEDVAKAYNKFDQRRKDQNGYEAMPMDYSPEAGLIAGFREGLLNMRVGDKVRLFIPSHLAWGAAGSRGTIPPNANVIFDIEITSIAK